MKLGRKGTDPEPIQLWTLVGRTVAVFSGYYTGNDRKIDGITNLTLGGQRLRAEEQNRLKALELGNEFQRRMNRIMQATA